MSGVCGHENRCGDLECPFTVCSGCPVAEVLDAAGIGKAESWEQVSAAMDAYCKPKADGCFRGEES